MSWTRRFANLLRSNRHARDIDRELAFHVGERADDLVAAGMSREVAEREARRRFGNYGAQKEDARRRHFHVARRDDRRHALRDSHAAPQPRVHARHGAVARARHRANTAIFTLINAVMLRSLPVAHPEELVQLRCRAGIRRSRILSGSRFATIRESSMVLRLRADAVQSRREW